MLLLLFMNRNALLFIMLKAAEATGLSADIVEVALDSGSQWAEILSQITPTTLLLVSRRHGLVWNQIS